MNGIELIVAERQRQIDSEGWTPEHDDEHKDYQLSDAAISYMTAAQESCSRNEIIASLWPWDISWWKPSDDPVRNLVKAGALIAAEIDRLQRKIASDK